MQALANSVDLDQSPRFAPHLVGFRHIIRLSDELVHIYRFNHFSPETAWGIAMACHRLHDLVGSFSFFLFFSFFLSFEINRI